MKKNKPATGIHLLPAAVLIMAGFITGCSDNTNDQALGPADNTGNDTVQEMVGNPDLDMSKMPPKVANALNDINKVVSSTENCSGANVKVTIPNGWQCRKLDVNPNDFTLYTDRNTLNLTIGTSQGMSSCNIIPTCSSESIELSGKFTDTVKFTQPMIGSEEITGTYKKDTKIKFLVTSNDALSTTEIDQIQSILDSIEEI
jgi:hypothetical protein